MSNKLDQLFERRDSLIKECEQLYKNLEMAYDEVNEKKEAADDIIDSSQELISSVKKTPVEFSRNIKKMIKEEKTYVENRDIMKANQNELIGERVEAICAMGAVGAGLLTIGGFFKEFVSGTGGRKIDPKLIIAAILLCVILLIWFLIKRSRKRRELAKEARKDIINLEKEKRDVEIRIKRARSLSEKITKVMGIIENLLESVSEYRGCDYKLIPDDEQIKLHSLVNNTLALSKMLNE